MGILEGRKAILVGASSGLGYGCALRFAEDGADVVAAARRLNKLEELAEDARSRGFTGKIIPVQCDIDKEEDLEALVERAFSEFGQIDILAAIAQGNLGVPAYLADTTPKLALESYRTGPLYTMLLMQLCFPHMKERNYGRIVTCASGSAVSATTGFTAYAMAKASVMTLTRKAAVEWGRYGITTNCIFPVTKNDHFGTNEQSKRAEEGVAAMSPVRYMGEPYKDASPIVSFIASEGAHYLNGQMIGICGGLQLLA
ncbi:MAG: SDR family oxidoreductase [Bifidobacteriaceae bacterium]|jgi:NAD(P)-dependent dehydrogenase (short-subunit alcohol dehydrogenase family)|nr:SDR family oxidoreductase [Bifidobacteriaceae bacterium]